MAEFKDISEFSLKPLLDGQEEIQISAEYKTTLMQIAKLVLSQLFTLEGFEKTTTGFGAISPTDTLMQVLQKVDLGFSNGKARIFVSDAPGDLLMGIVTESGIIGFDLQNEDIEFFEGSMDLSLSDDDIAEVLDGAASIYTFKHFLQESLGEFSAGTLPAFGGMVHWFNGSGNVSNIVLQSSFPQGKTSVVIGGLTQTTPPTLSAPSGWKLYKASNWDSVWAVTGMKVITVQRFSTSSNILVANVGLYLEA